MEQQKYNLLVTEKEIDIIGRSRANTTKLYLKAWIILGIDMFLIALIISYAPAFTWVGAFPIFAACYYFWKANKAEIVSGVTLTEDITGIKH